MTRRQVVQFFKARGAEWAARDADALAAGHAVTGTVVSPMFGTLRGRSEGVFLRAIEAGAILHEQRLYDYSTLLIQIGVLRSKPGF